MDPGLRRRLDALILISSALLGIVLTFLFFEGPMILLYTLASALVPTLTIATVALWYSDARSTESEGQ